MYALFTRLERYVFAALVTLALWAAVLVAVPAVAQAQVAKAQEKAPNKTNTQVAEQHVVVVDPGDTLWSISTEELRPNAAPWRVARGVERIYALNRDQIGPDSSLIFPGQRLLVPSSGSEPSASRRSADSEPPARKAAEAASAGGQAGRQARHETLGAPRQTAAEIRGEDRMVPEAASKPAPLPDAARAAPVPAARQNTAEAPPRSPGESFVDKARTVVADATSALVKLFPSGEGNTWRELLGAALLAVLSVALVLTFVLTFALLLAPERTRRSLGGEGRGTLLLALLGTHVPLLVVVAYLALSFSGGLAQALPVVGAALAGTLATGAIAFRELRALLTSVSRASRALRGYRERGETPKLPADAGGEGGTLLCEVQETVCRLDGVIGSLEQLAAKDPLTGAYNRRACEERLADDVARATRGEGRLALAVVDADYLKEVNDRWGHGVGDACLKRLADALGRNIREGDWMARWGGDEFVVAFWGVEGPADPREALRRCGEYLERNPVRLAQEGEKAAEEVRVGFSAGVSTYGGVEGARELFSKADAALIAAKKEGRDRVVAYTEAAQLAPSAIARRRIGSLEQPKRKGAP